MARPRVFVSSTYYDLKHVRSSLDNFIESLGFDSILSEKGDIAYTPDAALDESCYREASSADIFVLIIGGRYGSAASAEEKRPSPAFFERYESVTKKEFDSAISRDIPVYVLVEQNVYSEYHTFLRNKGNEKIQYAHVDSANVFRLIEEILARPRNNPVHTFERFAEIEGWLREQWSGLFRELLQRMSSQKQIATLSSQVETLGAINSTLQRYLEAVVHKVVPPENASKLIASEQRKLKNIGQLELLKRNRFFRMAVADLDIKVEDFREALSTASTFSDFTGMLGKLAGRREVSSLLLQFENLAGAMGDLNEAREIVGKPSFPVRTKASD